MQNHKNILFVIDVEGAEIEVVSSIPKDISCKADFIIESEQHQVEELSRLLRGKRKRVKLEAHPAQKNLAIIYGSGNPIDDII